MRVVRAARKVECGPGLQSDVFGLHVHRCAKCARAIGRSAHSALHLNTSKARCKVAHVYPIEQTAFGIVHRDAVGGNVNATGIGAANAHRGISHAVASIAGGNNRGHGCEQEGDVAPCVKALNLFLRHVGKGHWCFLCGASSHHLHILQLITAKRIKCFLFGVGRISRGDTKQCREQCHCFFHFFLLNEDTQKGCLSFFFSYASIVWIRSEGFISARNVGHPLTHAL